MKACMFYHLVVKVSYFVRKCRAEKCVVSIKVRKFWGLHHEACTMTGPAPWHGQHHDEACTMTGHAIWWDIWRRLALWLCLHMTGRALWRGLRYGDVCVMTGPTLWPDLHYNGTCTMTGPALLALFIKLNLKWLLAIAYSSVTYFKYLIVFELKVWIIKPATWASRELHHFGRLLKALRLDSWSRVLFVELKFNLSVLQLLSYLGYLANEFYN